MLTSMPLLRRLISAPEKGRMQQAGSTGRQKHAALPNTDVRYTIRLENCCCYREAGSRVS